ncbi:MAG TPA: hydantoinase B/oxoprolinase family protein [Actinocrinis sp.]
MSDVIPADARLDPVTTEVIGSALLSVTDEMSTALIQTAYSPNIKERADCSTALFDSGGRVLAQSQRLPLHMGSMLGSVRRVLERFPAGSLAPGDMFLANDPYHGGGSHLPDFNLVAPLFHDGELVGFAANCAHHSDVGGMVPGSESADCRDIYQEGLRIPPVRLLAAGELREDILAIVRLNSRVPEDRSGDLRAQIAANRVAQRRVAELCQRYGSALLRAHTDALLEATKRRITARFAELGAGEFRHTEYLDPLDPDHGEPLAFRVTLTVTPQTLTFDFTGTSEQVASGRNVPRDALAATAFCVVKTLLDPAIAANDGLYRSIRLIAPEGCLVNPVAPAPVGARALTCGVLADAFVGALSLAAPHRAVAGSAPHQLAIFAGTDPRSGRYFVDYETLAGAMGARAGSDGWDAVRIYASGAANLPVEPLEQAFPLRVERYELLPGSSGAGRRRGGLGIRRDYRVLAEEAEISLTGERHHCPAVGRDGGEDGGLGGFVLNPGRDDERRLPSVVRGLVLKRGDVLRVDTPGGAGYGPASLREDELARTDRAQGKTDPGETEATGETEVTTP